MREQPEGIREVGIDIPLAFLSLDAGYGLNRVVSDVDLKLHSGEKILLAGPNGCGKSTLLKAVIGQVEIFRGDVVVKGKSVLGFPTEKRISLGIAYLPQQRNVFPSLTIEENLILSHLYQTATARADAMNFVFEVFPTLRDKLQVRAGTLSGGERQSLAMGMAVRPNAVVYLLDEPSAGLSPKAASAVLEGVHALQKRLGFACLIVEHNLRYVCDWMDRALIMSNGKIVEDTCDVKGLLNRKSLERHFFKEQ